MNNDHFSRLCVPSLPVLVVAGAWLLNHLGLRVRTVSGSLSDSGRALTLVCKGMRSEKQRVFVLPFYTGHSAIAARLYLMSVLERTGKTTRYQLNGRPDRGMREIAYFGPTDRCQLIWSRSMFEGLISRRNVGWSTAKLSEMALPFPDAPTLVIDEIEYPLPTETQCDAIHKALELHNGAIHPRTQTALHDGLEASGLQVICEFNDLGLSQLVVEPAPVVPLNTADVFEPFD